MTHSDVVSVRRDRPSVGSPGHRLVVVGANPAMDRTEELEQLRPYEVNRALRTSPRGGGKGFIVARALRRLGHEVTLYGFLGGSIGQYLRQECVALGIEDRHTSIAGETRINTILVDRDNGLATVVNEPGPDILPHELASLRQVLRNDLKPDDILVLSGSLPRGVETTMYAGLVEIARERGVRTVVDAAGDVLRHAIEARPWAVKCNLQEFRTIAPDAPEDASSEKSKMQLFESMQLLVASGVELVIVTLGSNGLLALSKSHALHVSAARVVAKNPTGSGDTFLAAFVAKYAEGAALEESLKFGAAAASANAAVLIPDIGPSPLLDELIEGTRTNAFELRPASTELSGTSR